MARVKCPHCFHVNPDQQENCQKCNAPLPRIRIEARSMNEGSATPPGRGGPQFRRGQVVGGRYTVLNLIGQGGMGCIYKVHDNTLGEDVALKTLLPQFLGDKVVLERFYNEAKIARRLAHPNIVRVHDIGEDGKILYISMEYLQGMSLREVIENLKPGERLPIAQTLRIFDELCAALEYAHQFTIHRDIKPENVMLGQDGRVRLMDFGISKLMANTRLTGASVVMGTPFYMSPEQIRNSRDVDARSDIYSVGVMLYEILTGSVPTGIPRPASQIMKDVPPALDKIVVKCVDPNPRERYQNATELRNAFIPVRQMLKSGVSLPKREALGGRGLSLPWRQIGGAIAMVAIILAALWSLGRAEEHRKALALAVPEPLEYTGDGGAAAPTFAAYKALHETLRSRAQPLAGRGGVRHALDAGDALWVEARNAAASDEARAVALAGRAFQCYIALIMAPRLAGDMVFVPPGSIDLPGGREEYVEGFFIDRDEVTLGEYRDFVASEPAFAPLPADFANLGNNYNDYPIGDISCIDAMAYAAARGGLLPTEGQWSRAAYGGREGDSHLEDNGWSDDGERRLYNFHADGATLVPVGTFADDVSPYGCRDMIGNVAEWTRTSEDDPPTFGSIMTICGGSFSQPFTPPHTRSARQGMPFEDHDFRVGFRCVVEIPSSPAAAYAYLQ